MNTRVEVPMVSVGRVGRRAEDGREITARRHPQGVHEFVCKEGIGRAFLHPNPPLVEKDDRGNVDRIALGVLARNRARFVIARAATSLSGISLPPKQKPAIMPKPRVKPLRPDSNQQASGQPGAVQTDIGLPGLNGRQLADAAREQRPSLKVLFMTGYAESAASKSFLALGMAIVPKPVTMEILASKIREMVETKAGPTR